MRAKHFGLLLFFIVCAVISLITSRTFAQVQPKNANVTVSNSDFELLVGEWSGTLTYLDYTGDSTRATLNLRMEVAPTDTGMFADVTYIEPDGNEMKSSMLFRESHSGKRVYYDNKAWMLFDKMTTSNGTTLVFQGPGQDNNRNAQITNVLYMSHPDSLRQDSVVLTEKVLYENAGHEIDRHQFRLGRVKE